jgi:hypothetical protein
MDTQAAGDVGEGPVLRGPHQIHRVPLELFGVVLPLCDLGSLPLDDQTSSVQVSESRGSLHGRVRPWPASPPRGKPPPSPRTASPPRGPSGTDPDTGCPPATVGRGPSGRSGDAADGANGGHVTRENEGCGSTPVGRRRAGQPLAPLGNCRWQDTGAGDDRAVRLRRGVGGRLGRGRARLPTTLPESRVGLGLAGCMRLSPSCPSPASPGWGAADLVRATLAPFRRRA